MKVAIFGATGRLGQELVSSALDADFEVHAIVRHPEKITRAPDALTVYRGSVETGEGLSEPLRACHYAISAMSASVGGGKPNIAPCISNVLRELEQLRTLKRFVFISWIGAGDSAKQGQMTSGALSAITRLTRKAMFADMTQAEDLVRASKVPYVILRPTYFTDGPVTDRVVAVDSTEEPPARVSRRDLAKYVVALLEEPGWERREATVGTRRAS